ncbi:hypothetical protein [Streptacidiphilus carbonis]|uniref:hypothetical protein n=1 Tax=Streptacidiphilus carbonis TaxID=105422 RepID=UPI000ADD4F8D|nr:hypothetical protein [Streptacidiphilus carbonis]
MDEELARLVAAHDQLEGMGLAALREARELDDLAPFGTEELPVALAALEAGIEGGALDAIMDGARWLSRAFTATPMSLLGTPGLASEHSLALCGAVMGLRANLLTLDEAAQEMGPLEE